ncbi:MAG: hypothetical protein LUD46_14890 [Parabacteroides sp.]|nr:hypothetical protein [Parabacteroides sp.]
MRENTHDINEIIIHYLDGSAGLEDKKLLLQWLKQADSNRDDFIVTRDLWLSCNVTADNELEVDVALEKLKKRILQEQERIEKKIASEAKNIIGCFTLDTRCCRIAAFAGNRLWYR